MRIDPFLLSAFDEEINLDVCTLASEAGANTGAIHIQRRTPIEKKSSSPSDVVITELIVENRSIPIAMKMFLDYPNRSVIELYQSISGLKYEIDVYKYITQNILVYEQSPNFIGLIGHGECKMTNVEHIVNIENLKRYCSGLCTDTVYISMTNAVRTSFLAYLLNENQWTPEDCDSIMFQVLYALAVLEKHKLLHNDLHTGNIRLERLSNPVNLCFDANGTTYQFNTKYIIYIYDWDLAYCKELGNNPKLSPPMRDLHMRANTFIPRNDLRLFLFSLRLSDTHRRFDRFYRYLPAIDWSRQYYRLNDIQIRNVQIFREYQCCHKHYMFMTRKQMNSVFGTAFLKQNLDKVYSCSFYPESHCIIKPITDVSGPLVVERGPHPLEILQTEFKEYVVQQGAECYSNDFSPPTDVEDVWKEVTDYSNTIRKKLLDQEEKNYIIVLEPSINSESEREQYQRLTNRLVRTIDWLCRVRWNTSSIIQYNMVYIVRRFLEIITTEQEFTGYVLASYAISCILAGEAVPFDKLAQASVSAGTQSITEVQLMNLVDDIFERFPDLALSPTSSQFIDLQYALNDRLRCRFCAKLTLHHYEFGQFKPSEIANAVLSLDSGDASRLTVNENRCLEMLTPIVADYKNPKYEGLRKMYDEGIV